MKKYIILIFFIILSFTLTGCFETSIRKTHDFTTIKDLNKKLDKYEENVPLFLFTVEEDEVVQNIVLYEHVDKVFWHYSYDVSNPLGYKFKVILESEKSFGMNISNFGGDPIDGEEIIEGVKFRYVKCLPNYNHNRYQINCTGYFEFNGVYYFINIIYEDYREEIDLFEVVSSFVVNTIKDLSNGLV